MSLVENLAAQADTVKTLRHIYGGNCSAHISPVTLRKQFNPYATDLTKRAVAEAAQVDERQYSAFGAAWTLGSIKHLIAGGAGSATYFRDSGKLGIVDERLNPFPVFNAFKRYRSSSPCPVLASVSSAPLIADGLFFANGTGMVWNYTRHRQSVILPGGQQVVLGGSEIREVSFSQGIGCGG